MGRGEPVGMRDVSYFDALSGDATVSTNGSRKAIVAPGLEFVRHRARGVSAETHVAGRAGAWIRVDLSPVVFAYVDLATQPGGLEGGRAVSGDVVLVQAVESVLEIFDQATFGPYSMAAAGRDNAEAAFAISARVGKTGKCRWEGE